MKQSLALSPPAFSGSAVAACIADIRTSFYVLEDRANRRFGLSSEAVDGLQVVGQLAAIYPEWLGDRRFMEVHGCRFPYVVGEMARGVATPEMVVAAAKAGFLGFYGAAGLSPEVIA